MEPDKPTNSKEAPNPAVPAIDRYNDHHFRRIGEQVWIAIPAAAVFFLSRGGTRETRRRRVAEQRRNRGGA
ncbi:unnamed protein product [Linum trigynum]|uniref:Uncharacterized protein n=1 Tax=Linum trigynum TaxID=586398 RepID=A0AAV2CHF1_9ROSI